MALMGLGVLVYECNDLEAAENYFGEGMELISRWGEIGAMDGHLGLCLIEQAKGDFAAAHEHLQQAKELARRFDATEIDDIVVDLSEARLWIAEGKLDRVTHWAEEHGLADNDHDHAAELQRLPAIEYHLRYHQLLTLVRLQMAEERFDEAATLLDTLLAAMGERGWLDSRREIEVQALRALCLHMLFRQDEAFAALARALDLAEPDGYVRTFVDEGPPMAALLHKAAVQGMHPTYIRSLLVAFASSPTAYPLLNRLLIWSSRCPSGRSRCCV